MGGGQRNAADDGSRPRPDPLDVASTPPACLRGQARARRRCGRRHTKGGCAAPRVFAPAETMLCGNQAGLRPTSSPPPRTASLRTAPSSWKAAASCSAAPKPRARTHHSVSSPRTCSRSFGWQRPKGVVQLGRGKPSSRRGDRADARVPPQDCCGEGTHGRAHAVPGMESCIVNGCAGSEESPTIVQMLAASDVSNLSDRLQFVDLAALTRSHCLRLAPGLPSHLHIIYCAASADPCPARPYADTWALLTRALADRAVEWTTHPGPLHCASGHSGRVRTGGGAPRRSRATTIFLPCEAQY